MIYFQVQVLISAGNWQQWSDTPEFINALVMARGLIARGSVVRICRMHPLELADYDAIQTL